jgi:hypothetical protein
VSRGSRAGLGRAGVIPRPETGVPRSGVTESTHGYGQSTSEHAHDGRGLQTVADHVADRHRVRVLGQIHHVVPVAADVDANGRPITP